MTNSTMLRDAVRNAGLKYKFLAMRLDITPYGLQKKIDNMAEFKASEIKKLAETLELSESARNNIFLHKIVISNQQMQFEQLVKK